jgi:hypothetical protein
VRPSPKLLKESVGDAFDHFLHLSDIESGQAEHLRSHVARYGISLLCGKHGLPTFHSTSTSDGLPPLTETMPGPRTCSAESPGRNGGATGIRIESAVAIARFLRSVLDLAYAARRGRPVARWNIESVSLPGQTELSGLQQIALSALTPSGRLPSAASRMLVVRAAEEFLAMCVVRPGVSWLGRKRPELVMKAEDVWGMFALETIRRLSVDGGRRAVNECIRCGTAVVLSRSPRDGDQTYCFSDDCRREKERLRKAAQRAKGRVEKS